MNLVSLKNWLFRKNVIIALSIILLICLIEGIFDIAEITLGSILEITNPLRPRSGTIWEFDKQEQIADERLLGMTVTSPDESESTEINTLSQLKTVLDEQGSAVISAVQFLNIYNILPNRSAQEIISPLDLLKIYYSNQWIWTKIVKEENTLRFVFLQGNNQPLTDSYPDIAVLYHVYIHEKIEQKSLDSMPNFSGRTISPEQFFNSFNMLPAPKKLQLINNPFQLIKWHNNIRLVAVSRFINEHTVLIGFEIFTGKNSEVYTFQASELATNYLIAQLNSQYPDLNLTMPESNVNENNKP